MSHHDDEAVPVFEVISTFYVNIYINQVFNLAESDFRSRKARSLTTAYQDAVVAFSTGITSSKAGDAYRRAMTSLHNYFKHKSSKFRYVSYGGFVDGVVALLVPEEYFRDMRDQDRDETISIAVCDLINFYAKAVTAPEMLRRIIDERDKPASINTTIITLQDQGVSLLFQVRDRLFNQFLGQAVGGGPSESPQLVAKLKQAVRKLALENAKLVAEVRERDGRVAALEERGSELRKRCRAAERSAETAIAARTAAAAPVAESPPAPAQTRPAPAQTRPAPAQTRPAPAQTRPAPAQTRPAPAQTRPAPAQTRPAPAPALDLEDPDDPLSGLASSFVSREQRPPASPPADAGPPLGALLDDHQPGDFRPRAARG